MGATAWASLVAKILRENPNPIVNESCEDAIGALLPDLGHHPGAQVIEVLYDRLEERFDRLEIMEAYYRLAA